MHKTSRIILSWALGLVLGATITYVTFKRNMEDAKASRAILAIQEVTELALLDVAIQKIFEIQKENLKIGMFNVPFTAQRSLIRADGRAKLGYNVENLKIEKTAEGFSVTPATPTLIGLDVSYQFISEDDTWLNRITPEDRSSLLEGIRRELKQEALSPRLTQQCLPRLENALAKIEKIVGVPIRLQK